MKALYKVLISGKFIDKIQIFKNLFILLSQHIKNEISNL